MKKLNIIILFIFLYSCASQSSNIKFQKEYKKQHITAEFYFPPVPDPKYILIKRYFYTDSLLASRNFTEKRVKDSLEKVEFRKLILDSIIQNTPRMTKWLTFEVKDNAYGDIDIFSPEGHTDSTVLQSKNDPEILSENYDFSALDGQLNSDYIFIFKVDSWGFKYIDYEGSYLFLNTTGIIFDIKNKKTIWRRIKTFDISYNTSIQFLGFNDKNTLRYAKEAVNTMIKDYSLDLRR